MPANQIIALVIMTVGIFSPHVTIFFLERRIKALEAWQREVTEEQESAAASFTLDENDFDRQLL